MDSFLDSGDLSKAVEDGNTLAVAAALTVSTSLLNEDLTNHDSRFI